MNPTREAVADIRDRLTAAGKLTPELKKDADTVAAALEGKGSFAELPQEQRWEVRQSLFRLGKAADKAELKADGREHPPQKAVKGAIEYVPPWVQIGTALALGIGTMVGYKRIVVTVAEKIGKAHLSYAQGAAAETVAALTILLSTFFKMPVSTTQVLSSGVAGTMVANGNGVQGKTSLKILLAWVVTLPGTMLLSGVLFALGRLLFG